jgi:hypothetical protein
MDPRCREAVEKGLDQALEGSSVIVGLSSRSGLEATGVSDPLVKEAPQVRQRTSSEAFSV